MAKNIIKSKINYNKLSLKQAVATARRFEKLAQIGKTWEIGRVSVGAEFDDGRKPRATTKIASYKDSSYNGQKINQYLFAFDGKSKSVPLSQYINMLKRMVKTKVK